MDFALQDGKQWPALLENVTKCESSEPTVDLEGKEIRNVVCDPRARPVFL